MSVYAFELEICKDDSILSQHLHHYQTADIYANTAVRTLLKTIDITFYTYTHAEIRIGFKFENVSFIVRYLYVVPITVFSFNSVSSSEPSYS